jgi:hypothetical protein
MSSYVQDYSATAGEWQTHAGSPAPNQGAFAFFLGCFIWSLGADFSHFYGEDFAYAIAGGVPRAAYSRQSLQLDFVSRPYAWFELEQEWLVRE